MGKALNGAEIRQLRKTPPTELLFYVLERENPAQEDGSNPALDAADEALSSCDVHALADLIKQWQDFSRVSLGESSA